MNKLQVGNDANHAIASHPSQTPTTPHHGEADRAGINLQDAPVTDFTSSADAEKGLHCSDADASSVVKLDGKDDFPEGGLKAWSVVLGSFCGSFSVFGIINSTAIFQQYFSAHQLSDYTESQIGWIFGLSLFLTFFCGAPIGPLFDAYGPRLLIFCGSILLIASIMLLGLCTRTLYLSVPTITC